MKSLVTTYLEIRGKAALIRRQRTEDSPQNFEVRELKEPDWRFNREMYFKVGEMWKWIDKQPWTEAQWKEYAHDPNLRTFAGYCDEEIAGYFELRRNFIRHQRPEDREQNDDGIEIAYFGLLPEFIGRGLGGALLTSAIENAWAWAPAPSRVWVHTCNRDHPSALANYQARGFKIYKTVTCDR